MPCVIQYDTDGNISGTVHRSHAKEKPAFARQIEYENGCPSIEGMRVNLKTMKLEKAPPPALPLAPAVEEKPE